MRIRWLKIWEWEFLMSRFFRLYHFFSKKSSFAGWTFSKWNEPCVWPMAYTSRKILHTDFQVKDFRYYSFKYDFTTELINHFQANSEVKMIFHFFSFVFFPAENEKLPPAACCTRWVENINLIYILYISSQMYVCMGLCYRARKRCIVSCKTSIWHWLKIYT